MPLVPVAPTIVSAITCPKCKCTIFSRAPHDMHWCECGEVAVDGGLGYLRVNYKTEPPKVKKAPSVARNAPAPGVGLRDR